MIGSDLLERRSKPERIADQAWRQLTSAMNSAGDTVRTARRTGLTVADDAGDLVGSAAEEARRRTVRAIDALAGRRPAPPWGLLVGAALVGAVLGWAAGTAARAVAARDERNPEEIAFVDIDRPDSPASQDT